MKKIHLILFVSILAAGCASHSNNPSLQESQKTTGNAHSVQPALPGSPLHEESISDEEAAGYASDRSKNGTARLEETSSVSPDMQRIFDQALDFCQASQDFWQKGELDNAIEALDQAYSLILDIDASESPKIIQQKEDLRFTISKRILEIYASRNIVVNGNHNAIPITLNKHVQKEINRFTGPERKFFTQSYKRSGKYRPHIIKELKQAGLPEELSWLPLIESGFKTNALSSARALGLWQFIPSTGYKFGLKRNIFIDERLDPEKSTAAAIAYLKELHKIFGDWSTVLAAYNCGEGRVLRTIRKQNVNYLDNFWDLYNRLPFETARYVPRFLATLHIVNNMEKYGFNPDNLDDPIPHETVVISKQVSISDVAKELNVSSKKIKELNPELRYGIVPEEQYSLRVPPGKGEILIAKIDRIHTSKLPQRAVVYHRVRSGETLSTIARKYNTNVRSIARANNISRRNLIVAGKILKIPMSSSYSSARRTTPNNYRHATRHVVSRGDSLWNIARRYGTTTKKIQDLNNLATSNLHIGQVLILPGKHGNSNPPSGSKSVYLVKKGDNPFTIASAHNMNLKRLLQINRLTSKSKIFPGQQLYVE